MNQDEYGDVINGADTYADIAEKLAEKLEEDKHLLIGWTDGLGTHFDILIANGSMFSGYNHQGGIRPHFLFVAIMSLGAFGFDQEFEKHPDYISEKLHVGGGVTAEKLAELINGIMAALK